MLKFESNSYILVLSHLVLTLNPVSARSLSSVHQSPKILEWNSKRTSQSYAALSLPLLPSLIHTRTHTHSLPLSYL